MIAETERLWLREISIADAEEAYLLNLDPEVIQYTGDIPFPSVDAAREFLASYDHYRKYGFGRWAMIRKTDDAFIGWCGLKYTAEDDEFDIGFRLNKQYWNQGYATEASMACIQLGFTKFNMPLIVGRVMAENTGSVRVLEKCGLVYQSDFDFDGHRGLIYQIQNPENNPKQY